MNRAKEGVLIPTARAWAQDENERQNYVEGIGESLRSRLDQVSEQVGERLGSSPFQAAGETRQAESE
jgi:hypothetical protein